MYQSFRKSSKAFIASDEALMGMEVLHKSNRALQIIFFLCLLSVVAEPVLSSEPTPRTPSLFPSSIVDSGRPDKLHFSTAEQVWLAQNHVVRARIGDYAPIQFFTDKPTGIAVDYLNVIAEKAGLQIEYKRKIPWGDALNHMRDRNGVDLLLGAMSTPERREYMAFTDVYLSFPSVIFTLKNSAFIGSLEDLSGKVVSVQDKIVAHNLLVNKYPDIKLQPKKTEEAALLSLINGESDASVGNLIVGSFYIQSNGWNNVKIAAPTGFDPQKLSMAVRSDWPELSGIINKALASFSPAEHMAMRSRWSTPIRYEYGISSLDVVKWVAGISSFLGVIIAIVLWWNKRLGREILLRTKVENELTRSQQLLTETGKISKVGGWEFNLDTESLQWTEEVYRIHEVGMDYSPSVENALEFYSDASKPVIAEALQRTIEHDELFDLELDIVTAKGNPRHVHAMGMADLEHRRVHGIFQDITERKLTEANQAFTQKRLEALWNISRHKNDDIKTICNYILDEIVSMTQSPYGFYGFMNDTEDTLTLHSWSKKAMGDCAVHDKPIVYPIEDSGIWGNAVRTRAPFILNNYRNDCEYKKGLPKGHVSLTRVLSVPLFLSGKIVAVAAVANKEDDYTDEDIQQLDAFLLSVHILIDQKQAEQEKATLVEQLHQAQKIESIGQLAGGIAHDFNNILAGLYGNVSLAKTKLRKSLPDHPGYRYLDDAEKSMNRATALTNQLLTFAKGGAPLKGAVSLSHLIEEVVPFNLSGSNVKPVISQPDNLWLAFIDQGQVQQVFGNLTINAKQAMPGGGELQITLENVVISDKQLLGLDGGKYIRVTLADNGTGIAPEHLERIFEPYYTTKQAGNGLGLATAYSIITKHGGHISVAPQLGQGTTFTLYLPAAKDQNLPPVPAVSTTAPRQQTARVLIMDDEEMICDIVKTMLEDAGHTVETVPDGRLALDRYQQALETDNPFDLVILDLTIPGGLGGKEVVKQILDLHPLAKVIVSSGYADDPLIAHYTDYGFKAVVPKPFENVVLIDTVNKVLMSDSN